MKQEVRAASVQIDVAWFDPKANMAKIRDMADRVRSEGPVDLVVFPELANSGYVKGRDKEFGREYVKIAEPVPGPFTNALGEIARRHGIYLVCGLLQAHPTVPGTVYNASVMLSPTGEVIGLHHKMHIPGEERHYFYPGNTTEVVKTDLGQIGLIVCADRRFPELTRVLTLMGAEIVCCVANIPGADRVRQDPQSAFYVPRCRAMENRIFFVESNRIGTQEEMIFSGHSSIADPGGNLLACSECDDEAIVRASLCADTFYEARAMWPDFRDRRPEHYGLISQLN